MTTVKYLSAAMIIRIDYADTAYPCPALHSINVKDKGDEMDIEQDISIIETASLPMRDEKKVLVISKSEGHVQGWLDISHPKFQGASITHVDFEENDTLAVIKELASDIYDEMYIQFLVPDEVLLTEIGRVAKQGGKLLIEKCIADRTTGQALSTLLTQLGFRDTMAAKDPVSGDRFITCQWGA